MIKINGVTLYHGDSEVILDNLEENSIDSIVCDPPYHLNSIVKRFGDENSAEAQFGTDGVYQRSSKGFMGKCYHPNTEIMTKTGWKRIGEILSGDIVSTFNPETRTNVWQNVENTYQYDYEGELINVNHRSCEQLVTPNHNLMISKDRGSSLEFIRADETPRQFHLFSQTKPISGISDDFIRIESTREYGAKRENKVEIDEFDAKSFFKFFGLWLGDGYVVSRVNDHSANDFFGISVKKKRKVEVIRNSLNELNIKYSETVNKNGMINFYCYNFTLLSFLKKFGKAKDKYIPNWIFDYDFTLLNFIYEGLIETDGCRQGNKGQVVYHTSSKRLADDFQRLCFHIGKSCISTFNKGGNEVKIGEKLSIASESWTLSVLDSGKRMYGETSKRKGNVIYKVKYSGPVNCIEVKNHHIIMTRYNGKPVWSGNSWDGGDIAFRKSFWKKAFRVLKPGGHLAAFGASRGYHRMACAIEDAGFEIRDSLMWIYGTGFPKSHDISKAIDKELGYKRETVIVDAKFVRNPSSITGGRTGLEGATRPCIEKALETGFHEIEGKVPVSQASKEWEGFGTALKPSFEPIVLARKPISEKSIAANVLKWGTGALNIDGCRIQGEVKSFLDNPVVKKNDVYGKFNPYDYDGTKGRWPANICHDGSDEVVSMFPNSKSCNTPSKVECKAGTIILSGKKIQGPIYPGESSAARFFYSAKANEEDREFSKHPTVKPVDLMRWLVRLVTPPNGIVLDCFAGSGTTGAAAYKEGLEAILIERERMNITRISFVVSIIFR